MEPRHLIRVAIAASVLGHLALAAGVFMADAQPMEAHDDSVSVDLVTPQDLVEAEKKADQAPPEPNRSQSEPEKPEFRLPDLTIKPSLDEQQTAAAPAAQPSSTDRKVEAAKAEPQKVEPQEAPQQQVASRPVQQPQPDQRAAPQSRQLPPRQEGPPPSPLPALQQQAALQPPPDESAEQPPPQPDADISVKYGVNLGLPGFGGAPASEQADLSKTDIAAFHRHLKTCLKLPAGVARGDDAMVKLRATLSPEGRLLAEPTVMEVRRPAKAALLLQAAKQALQSCQPYSMLPADKYDEWKVLDLPFTSQDFAG